MLDEKLKELIIWPVQDYDLFRLSNEDIATIKQAFADEYKRHLPEIVGGMTEATGWMTGQEWYERFWQAYETDLPKIADATIIREQVDRAAKKASGLKDE